MSAREIVVGTTGVTEQIFCADVTSSTGAGLALLYSAAGLVGEYRRWGQSSWTAITLATATLGTFTSGGFIADGSLTGAAEVGIPNAAFASGSKGVTVRYYGASNMKPVLLRYELIVQDNQVANVNANLQQWLGSTPNALQSGRVDSYMGAIAQAAADQLARYAANYDNFVFVRTTGNDSTGTGSATAPFALPSHAATVAAGLTGKTLILVGPGTFDDSANRIKLPAGCDMSGAGMYATTILVGVGGSHVSINPSSGATLSDFHCKASDFTIFIYPIGSAVGFGGGADFAPTDFALKRIWIEGGSDALWVASHPILTLIDCKIQSQWDLIGPDSPSSLRGYNVEWICTGGSSAGGSPSNVAHGVKTACADLILVGGSINVQNGGTGGDTTAVENQGTGIFTLIGMKIFTANTGSDAPIDVRNNAGGIVRLLDVNYSPQKVDGTVTVIQNSPINGTGQIAAGALATDAINGAAVKADAVTKLAGGVLTDTAHKVDGSKIDAAISGVAASVWNVLSAGITTANSIGKRLLDFVTTLVYVAPDNAGLALVKAQTDKIGTNAADSPHAVQAQTDAANAAARAQTAATNASGAEASAEETDGKVDDLASALNDLAVGLGFGGDSNPKLNDAITAIKASADAALRPATPGRTLAVGADGSVTGTGGGGGGDPDAIAARVVSAFTQQPTAQPAQQFNQRSLIQGDSFSPTSRSFLVSRVAGADWPANLSLWNWTFAAKPDPDSTNASAAPFTGTVTVAEATGDSRSLVVTIPTASTLQVGPFTYSVRGTLISDATQHWTVESGVLRIAPSAAAA